MIIKDTRRQLAKLDWVQFLVDEVLKPMDPEPVMNSAIIRADKTQIPGP